MVDWPRGVGACFAAMGSTFGSTFGSAMGSAFDSASMRHLATVRGWTAAEYMPSFRLRRQPAFDPHNSLRGREPWRVGALLRRYGNVRTPRTGVEPRVRLQATLRHNIG